MSKSNLIVCANNNGELSSLFKVSPENIVGDNPVPVSSQYEGFNLNKMSFTGSGEFTGIYYETQGNNLGCRGVYVIGIYSATTGTNSILNKEVTLYLSDKQLSELQSGTSLLKQCDNKTTTFDNSYYTDKASLIAHLKTVFETVTDDIKFSYTSNNHYTDSLQFVSFDETYCSATFKWVNGALHIFNNIFANDPGSIVDNKYWIRTYDTALFSYDMLDFGVVEIYPTCFAVGTNNTVAGDGAIATGLSSKAMGAFSAAFGRSSQARGYSTFAAGHKSKALNERSVALGDSCEAQGVSSFAAGYQSIANSDYSIALGNNCKAQGVSSFAASYKSIANSDYSIALGNNCKAQGVSSFAAGYRSITNNNYSVALGCQCITGDNATGAFAAGYQSKTNKDYSVALGCQCITGDNAAGAFAAGYKSKANNFYSVALGNNCIAKAANSFAVGYQSIANKDYSVALGNNCITGAASQCVVGKYNCKNTTAVFAVGGGSSESVKDSAGNTYKKIKGKNIFEITSDGQIIVPVQGTTENKFASISVVWNKDTNNIDLEYRVVDNPRTGTIWIDSDGNEYTEDPTIQTT